MLRKVIIIGGGLAGLIAAIKLKKAGLDILLVEKKSYPFHRVCGEYISNEVKPFLQDLGVYPSQFGPAAINRFVLTSTSGEAASLTLEAGGFGISRYNFDNYLYECAEVLGVDFMLNTQVSAVNYDNAYFNVTVQGIGDVQAEIVIGAFGKRSKLDKQLGRSFFKKSSPYLGVKYHVSNIEHGDDSVALHNFRNGYCGINKIEEGRYNLCYMTSRDNLTASIAHMEEHVLCENPYLEKVFSNARFLFDKPEVINEISFETKNPVENHILMCGDAAGMITPLCGNGMAIAIHSAKLATEEVIKYFNDPRYSRQKLERTYAANWNRLFKRRLFIGRQIQKLFGSSFISNMSVKIAKNYHPAANFLVRQTHGKVFY